MTEDLLKSLEIESDGIRETHILQHLDTFQADEITQAQMFPIAQDYFYQFKYDRAELLDMKSKNKAVEMTDQDEEDHANINLLRSYLKDNYEGNAALSKDDAIVLLSHEKLRAFHEKWLSDHMFEKDYLTIHKAEGLQKLNVKNRNLA